MSQQHQIVGRYAPSPTGDLHLGNLRTALLAWLHARVQGGQFLLRMEDLDAPRVVDGSAEKILNDLEWFGIDWDGEVIYQSQRTSLYQDALSDLSQRQLVYPCFCSRKDIQQAASAPDSIPGIYNNQCRDLPSSEIEAKSKLKAPAMRVRVSDRLAHTCGDFVVKRADNLFAYQLAVVVDDLDQGVTEVVRGADLIDSTERQLYLAQLLAHHKPAYKTRSTIRYLHMPLMHDDQGNKMSKRDGSLSVDECRLNGYSAERLVGEFAYSLNLVDKAQDISASELATHLNLNDIEGLN